MDVNGMIASAKFSYRYREGAFIWIPLIFYPDFIMGISGGYHNDTTKAKGIYARELIMRKFVLDAD